MVNACPCCKRGFTNLELHLAKAPLCSSRFWEIKREQIREAQRQVEARRNRPSPSDGASRDENLFPVSNVVFNLDLLDHQSVATRLTRGQRKRRRQQQEHDEVSSLTDTVLTASHATDDNNDPGFGMYDDDDLSVGSVDNVVAPPPTPPQLLFDADDSTPPPLGTRFTYPVKEAIALLPNVLAKDAALVDLMKMLNDAGCPCYLFNEIVKFMECHSGTTFPAGKKIDKRETLVNRLVARFPVPEPTPVQVVLEHGSDEEGDYRRRWGDSVSVQTWDFEKMCQTYLLDPFLFGDPNNLVNSQNPFGKYVPVGPSDKEVLASYWYSKTYDEYITDPETQFLLPLEMYLDKTGKTAGMTSYCGEPLIWASVLLRYAIRQYHETWRIQGYLNDLEKTSSAKKTLSSGRKGEMGRTLRNYHKVAAAVLQSVVECQNKGGFDGFVRMGDEVRYMRIIPVYVFLKGDGKSGDAVVARYGGKNCKMRVPRLCLTSLDELDDPLRACPLMVGEHLDQLYTGATRPASTRELERERKRYLKALADTSTHVCDNAFSKLDFGYNPFGITLATPTDMMHAFESGIMPRVLKCFVASMGTTVRVTIDNLIEDMFKPLRSTVQSEFVRVNFVRGPTSLTLLSSHEWPGMTFTFLVVLLSPKGRQICEDCFQDDDVPENDHDWESAPGVDLSNTYVPPILNDQVRGTAAQGGATEDNEEEQEHQEEEFIYEDEDDTSTVANGSNKPKGPVKMTCSHRQFVNLLIELLSFHAWYKYGNAPFGPEYQHGDADSLLTSIRQMINRIISFCPRNEGNGWKLQKLHDILHLPITLVFFRHASQYDAGPGERLLKDFFKDVAKRSQQRGDGVFIGQVARRMHEKMVLSKASAVIHALEHLPSNDVDTATSDDNRNNNAMSFPQKRAYTLRYSPETAGCTFVWNHSNKATQVHPVVLSWFGKYWDGAVGEDIDELDCFTELISGRHHFRAHPNFQNRGAWYDWALAQFDATNEESYLIPSRVLLFYRDNGGCIMALVQTCNYMETLGDEEERAERLFDTPLCSRWEIASQRGSDVDERTPNIPKLYSVPAESLMDNVIVIEEEPGLCESWMGKRCVWLVKDRKTEWSTCFPPTPPE